MHFVYTNSAYWVEKFEDHIRDLVRITQPGGYIVLQIKNANIKKYTSKKYIPFMGDRFHDIVDAGRASTWKGLKPQNELVAFLSSLTEVSIEGIDPIYGDVFAKVWDIGLRPLFNPLVKMANSLNLTDRKEVKSEWNEILFNMFEELLINYQPIDEQAIEHNIVLRKKC